MGLVAELLFLVGEIAVNVAKQRRDNRLAREERRNGSSQNGRYLHQSEAERSRRV